MCQSGRGTYYDTNQQPLRTQLQCEEAMVREMNGLCFERGPWKSPSPPNRMMAHHAVCLQMGPPVQPLPSMVHKMWVQFIKFYKGFVKLWPCHLH
jgi:hypothetical protein